MAPMAGLVSGHKISEQKHGGKGEASEMSGVGSTGLEQCLSRNIKFRQIFQKLEFFSVVPYYEG